MILHRDDDVKTIDNIKSNKMIIFILKYITISSNLNYIFDLLYIAKYIYDAFLST